MESLRSKLDDVGLKIAEHQEDSMQNRRKLAETTREFKKTAQDSAIKGVGPLLKQYQEEVDRLTKVRSCCAMLRLGMHAVVACGHTSQPSMHAC